MLYALYKQIQKNYVAKTSISDDINTQQPLQIAFRKKIIIQLYIACGFQNNLHI